jgi:hypothetical protein
MRDQRIVEQDGWDRRWEHWREHRSWGWDGDWDWCADWCGDFWRTDRFDALAWAALFLWAAVLMVVASTGVADARVWWDGWSLFFTGAGVIVITKVVARTYSPARRRYETPSVIFGTILMAIGLGGYVGAGLFWPVVLAIIAGSILFRTLRRR